MSCDLSSPYKEKIKISNNPIVFYFLSIIISSIVLFFYQTNIFSFADFLIKLRENKQLINKNPTNISFDSNNNLFSKIINKILYFIIFLSSKLEWKSFVLDTNTNGTHTINRRGFSGVQSLFLTSGLFFTIVSMISVSTLTYYSLTFNEDSNIKKYFYDILYYLVGIPVICLILFIGFSYLIKLSSTYSIYPILTIILIVLIILSYFNNIFTDILSIFIPLSIIIISNLIINKNWNVLDLLPSVFIIVFILSAIKTGNYISKNIFNYDINYKNLFNKELKESNEKEGEEQVETLLESHNITLVGIVISLVFLLFLFILNFKQPILNNFVFFYVIIPIILILCYIVSFTNIFKDTGNNKCHSYENNFNDNVNSYCSKLKECEIPV